LWSALFTLNASKHYYIHQMDERKLTIVRGDTSDCGRGGVSPGRCLVTHNFI